MPTGRTLGSLLERRSSNPIYKVEATDNQGFRSDLTPDGEYLTDALARFLFSFRDLQTFIYLDT